MNSRRKACIIRGKGALKITLKSCSVLTTPGEKLQKMTSRAPAASLPHHAQKTENSLMDFGKSLQLTGKDV
jgi:hypothetical protein